MTFVEHANCSCSATSVLPSRDELVEALTHCCRTAIRAPHVFGSKDHPSAWDRAHATLDVLLDE